MIDKNEAPEGYEAVKEKHAYSCKGCDLADDNGNCTASRLPCSRFFRTDDSNVIFVKKPEEIKMEFDINRVCYKNKASTLHLLDKVLSANTVEGLQALLHYVGNGVKPETLIGISAEKGFQTDYEGVVCSSSDYYEYVYLLEGTKVEEKELSVSAYKRMKVIAEKGIIDILDAFETSTKSDVTDINFIDSDHVKLEAEFWD